MKEKVVENLHLLHAAKTGFGHKHVYYPAFPINCESDRCNIIILFVHCTMQRHFTGTSAFYWLFRAGPLLSHLS